MKSYRERPPVVTAFQFTGKLTPEQHAFLEGHFYTVGYRDVPVYSDEGQPIKVPNPERCLTLRRDKGPRQEKREKTFYKGWWLAISKSGYIDFWNEKAFHHQYEEEVS